ncbi:MAG: hypothetical protein KJO05_01220 [Bacteroidia bacterium]|nr:hypothetical protein [Bacteroidia bacterium]NNF31291.1 hypothetical protein [Flavobacteriaceae bacterium]MBT8274617.1 hypothetical protein [Bacteroidia bacterium]NNJ83029.1 hypothetical protein [Flavobacteriaceae bacterium]NNK54213.1 hypothetical protein [Flavobacteriaceae bacterium]
MRKPLSFLLLLLLFFTNNLYSQQFNNALEYLEFVSNEQEIITRNTWKYTKAIAHSKRDRTIASKRSSLIKSIERALTKINKANAFEGDDFKENVLKNLELNKSLLQQDYAKIIDMKAVAEQSYDAMEAYMLAQELADKKMAQAQQEFEVHYYQYAREHNINIIESESDLGKKMKISSEVFDHYNDLYLMFFKVNMNEVYLYDALERSDVSAIEQSAGALSESAKEGLKKLDTVSLYKKDRMLVDATRKAFEFFEDEADNKIPVLTDFLIANEDFEAIKSKLDGTPERKRTKAQIDAYNEKVSLINKAVENYNKTNAALNKKREAVLGNLNAAYERFLAKHIPKD